MRGSKTGYCKASIFVAILAVLTLSFTISAATGWTASGGTVSRVYAGFTAGTVLVGINGAANLNNCDSSTLAFTSANSKPGDILKLVLTAQASGREIKCWIDSGCVDPTDVGGSASYQVGNQCFIE